MFSPLLTMIPDPCIMFRRFFGLKFGVFQIAMGHGALRDDSEN